ncbi:MAG: 4Fe-4S dicluster domain-containing protein [Oxalobacter sp.]|nr:MAG: 4Fe-4S dicluster domain-containing protein [Oxalobacter sp.]
MQVDALKLIYFSPTETSVKVAVAIAKGMGVPKVTHLNLTVPQARSRSFPPVTDHLAIIAMPVYGGRLPEEAVARLRRVQGNGTPAVVVVLYGNRAYEDALIELRDVASECGFVPVAAGAFIGEHSYANDQAQIALGRPDENDLAKAREFGGVIRTMMNGAATINQINALTVPGNVPYQDYRVPTNIAPVSDEARCTNCGVCMMVCPTGAIALRNNTMVTDASQCILCAACVKACVLSARFLNHERIVKVREMLVSKFTERREPETFMGQKNRS